MEKKKEKELKINKKLKIIYCVYLGIRKIFEKKILFTWQINVTLGVHSRSLHQLILKYEHEIEQQKRKSTMLHDKVDVNDYWI